MKELTLVIPAKFESSSLPKVLKELENIGLKKLVVIPKYDFETKKAVENFNCQIIHQSGEGFGNAIIEGINQVQTKYLCIFNADGSFDPKYLNEMLALLISESDFVFNSRYIKGGGSDDDTILTYVGNLFFTKLCNILFKLNISDVLFTYVMGKSEAFKELKLKSPDFTFCVELPVKAKFRGFRILSNPSYERTRISGKKKVNEFKDGFLILISIFRLFIKKI